MFKYIDILFVLYFMMRILGKFSKFFLQAKSLWVLAASPSQLPSFPHLAESSHPWAFWIPGSGEKKTGKFLLIFVPEVEENKIKGIICVYSPVYLSKYLFIYLFVHLSIYFFISLSIYSSICLSIHLLIYLTCFIYGPLPRDRSDSHDSWLVESSAP